MQVKYVDCHCHLDQYKDPLAIIKDPKGKDTFIIAVTNLPSHFKIGLMHTRPFTNIRISLGFHPLTASKNVNQLELFENYFDETSYIGEIGLDFSKEGIATKNDQIKVFSRIAQKLSNTSSKMISVHSRGAEQQLLEIVDKYRLKNIILHWFTGPNDALQKALSLGCFFSINPKMTITTKGKNTIEAIPYSRILTESDGPYAKIFNRMAMPWDASIVIKHLSETWQQPIDVVKEQVWTNFINLTKSLPK